MVSTAADSATKPMVLIAGSGPSGLFLALSLAKNGIPVRIIEKSKQFHQAQRGAGAMPRTLEIYNYLGAGEDIARCMMPYMEMAVYKLPEGKEIIKSFYMEETLPTTPPVPFRNIVIVAQYVAEGILRKQLAKYDVVPELATELVGFEQDEAGVTVHLVKHDGDKNVEETVSVDYVVGAEGAHSIVRKTLGLTFVGESRPSERLVIADIEIKGLSPDHWHSWGEPATRVVWIRPTERPNVFFMFGGGKKANIDAALQGRDGIVKFIQDVTGRRDLEFGELKFLTDWKYNVRLVNKFGEGRAFVVGDAAHVHSPAGGQGMNSGAQDAFNLGWKLALVCKSLAPPSILETYTDERLPVIRDMLERTTKLFDKTLKFSADGQNADGFKRPRILHQLGVHCRWSALVVDEQPEAAAARKADPYRDEDPSVLFAGDRAPDAPALRVIARANGAFAEAEETSLFKTYTPARHTAVLFAASADLAQLRPVLDAVHTAPKDTVQVVVIFPKGTSPTSPQTVDGADLVVVDTLGHAADAYPPAAKGFPVIIVRPDGVVGSVVNGEAGVKRYIKGVFIH